MPLLLVAMPLLLVARTLLPGGGLQLLVLDCQAEMSSLADSMKELVEAM